MSPIGPGDVFEVAMVSPLVSGCLTVATEEERMVWQPADPERLALVLGHGVLSRTEREENRFREVVLVGPERDHLLVLPRVGAGRTEMPAQLFEGRAAPEEQLATGRAWDELASWLTSVFLDAAARSEFVVVERGGWEFTAEPYGLALVLPDGDTDWRITLESNPRPDGTPNWQHGDDPRGQTMTARADPESLHVVGPLLTEAIRCWAGSPLDVAVTFGRSPAPPFRSPSHRP